MTDYLSTIAYSLASSTRANFSLYIVERDREESFAVVHLKNSCKTIIALLSKDKSAFVVYIFALLDPRVSFDLCCTDLIR